MTSFFKATTVAAQALYGDFKFKPYYNLGFHLDASSSFVCHILRALYDLTAFVLRTLLTPVYIAIPFFWLKLPGNSLNLIDDLTAFVITAVTIAIHPIISIVRTVSSLIWGYEENSDFDEGRTGADEDIQLTLTIRSSDTSLLCC